jgi:hypothetical protein
MTRSNAKRQPAHHDELTPMPMLPKALKLLAAAALEAVAAAGGEAEEPTLPRQCPESCLGLSPMRLRPKTSPQDVWEAVGLEVAEVLPEGDLPLALQLRLADLPAWEAVSVPP